MFNGPLFQQERIPTEHNVEPIPKIDKNLQVYLRKELRGYTSIPPDEIIQRIDEISRIPDINYRNALIDTLQPILEDKTLLFVNRLFGYQKKPCRDGINCRRLGCYYKHPENDINRDILQIEEYSQKEDKITGNKFLLEKQRRIIEILIKRQDLPTDLYGLVEQLKRLNQKIKQIAHNTTGEEVTTRFVIMNRKDWMTRDHLSTYPGVVQVSDDGVIECNSKSDAQRVFEMILKLDPSCQPHWVN
ncbi:hypothetical protein NEOKW01_1669 [Nematocida sp. AWRm80]|nr:hypothetical protein NEOKW01_1669 [Nematocida sp. AWRm80]